jgi:two-component system, chemotaxis family, chemotaxis protein CheY
MDDKTLSDMAKDKKILVVDDEQFMRSAIGNVLIDLGFDYAKGVATGEEALDYLSKASNKVDFIFLDATLPKLDGGAVLKIIRKSPKIPDNDVTVIMMTAMANHNEMANFAKHKISGYLGKPITPKALRQVMERILQNPAAANAVEPEEDDD